MLTRSTISDTSVQVITAVAIKNSIRMNDIRSVSAYLRPFWDERIGMLAYPYYLSSFFVILDTFLNLTILHMIQPLLPYEIVRFPFQLPLQGTQER